MQDDSCSNMHSFDIADPNLLIGCECEVVLLFEISENYATRISAYPYAVRHFVFARMMPALPRRISPSRPAAFGRTARRARSPGLAGWQQQPQMTDDLAGAGFQAAGKTRSDPTHNPTLGSACCRAAHGPRPNNILKGATTPAAQTPITPSVQESGYRASLLVMSFIIAVWMKARLVSEKRSKSFARRRFIPSHASVRSTIQRFGSIWKAA